MAGPLDGIVVADFTQLVQGPYASQVLSDLGAEVIKIEPPNGDWLRRFALGNTYLAGESVSFLAFNRNKQSIVLNLKRDDHKEVARRIVASADVVLENFRPGVMDRLGLGYESLATVNPGLVYCASSGYGTDGPYETRPGQDLLIQALTGLPLLNGRESDPPIPVAVGVADLVAGLHMVYATLAALVERGSSGKGQRVDVNLLNSLLALQSQELTAHMNSEGTPKRPANMAGNPYTGAPFGLYPTSDGYLAIAMNPVDKLMDVLGIEGWTGETSQNVTEAAQDAAVRAALTERLVERTTNEWLELLLGVDIWCAPLNDYDQVVADPQVRHNEMIVELEHPTAGTVSAVGIPTRFSRTPGAVQSAPPLLGEHTDDVLRRAGYSDDEIQELAL